VLGSEAEIGSSDFHAGEIACGFIEQFPEEALLRGQVLRAPGREYSSDAAGMSDRPAPRLL